MIDPDLFWRLLPQIHRRRDIERDAQGGPLRRLLVAFAEQAALLEADIARQYDNWFIETCEDWVVPYIGDLIGYTPVHDTGDPGAGLRLEDQALRRVAAPRAEAANTIGYRRRKGTLALLERLAADVAGWPARAVEFRDRVASTQHIRVQLAGFQPIGTADIRAARPRALGSADDPMPRSPDMRRIAAASRSGRYGPHQVGLYVVRHIAVPVTRADAACAEQVGPHCFTFSPLGLDMPLYRPEHAAARILPGPLSRDALRLHHVGGHGEAAQADPGVYGESGCVMVWVQPPRGGGLVAVPAAKIVPASLRQWHNRPTPGHVALDPERGRLMFPERETPERVVVSYHEGTMGDLGAGERLRRLSPVPRDRLRITVRRDGGGGDGSHASLGAAVAAWHAGRHPDTVIEILDSATYDESRLQLSLRAGQRLEIRAAARRRPLLRIADAETPRDDAWRVTGEAASALVLDGLLIAGRGLQLRGGPGALLLRRCTLVPGWTLPSGGAAQALPPSLTLDNATTAVTIQHSILGPIHVRDNELDHEPLDLRITDSVLDGGGMEAITGPEAVAAHVSLTIKRSTVLGRSAVHAVRLAEDCLFTRRLLAARRQQGCVRFCYLPPGSKTPRRYGYIPVQSEGGAGGGAGGGADAGPPLVPAFVSLQYGQPGYCQLAHDGPAEIRRGAGDASELGVFHNLFDPQREANLLARLAEFVPATVDVGIIHVT